MGGQVKIKIESLQGNLRLGSGLDLWKLIKSIIRTQSD
jgi:hypothetical protein